MPGFNVAQPVRDRQDDDAASHTCAPEDAEAFGGTGTGAGRATGRRPYGTIFRSLFGEPLPGPVTLPEVAPFTRAVATWAGVAEVWPAR